MTAVGLRAPDPDGLRSFRRTKPRWSHREIARLCPGLSSEFRPRLRPALRVARYTRPSANPSRGGIASGRRRPRKRLPQSVGRRRTRASVLGQNDFAGRHRGPIWIRSNRPSRRRLDGFGRRLSRAGSLLDRRCHGRAQRSTNPRHSFLRCGPPTVSILGRLTSFETALTLPEPARPPSPTKARTPKGPAT